MPTSAKFPENLHLLQGHPRLMILVPIESTHVT